MKARILLLIAPILLSVACRKKVDTPEPVVEPKPSGITLSGRLYETPYAELINKGTTSDNLLRIWELNLLDIQGNTTQKINRTKASFTLYSRNSNDTLDIFPGIYEHNLDIPDEPAVEHKANDISSMLFHVGVSYDGTGKVVEDYGKVFDTDTTELNGSYFLLEKENGIYTIEYNAKFDTNQVNGFYSGIIQRK